MKKEQTSLELLAPAKNLEVGKAAILHGADAVYIGAPRFGARQAAGNSIDDIAELCQYAHQFGVKVYVTANTIVYDDELSDVEQMVNELSQIGVDALLVQDMSLLGSPITLHASTQTDNRTPEKVLWLRSLGFKRVVLARELSLRDIKAIHEAAPDVELEAFVHGALCVSYSGVCYASEHCFARSANRGECAQFCRLKFNLEDADGNKIERDRHMLSLKDMCRIDYLEGMAEAGVCSFKIEGRLKDIEYVKNVVSAYSQRLNEIIQRNPQKYKRASRGRVQYFFKPDLHKTFNRGYTDYFLHGRRKCDYFSPDTPKAMGEYVGYVKEIRGNSFNVAGTATFANGDGLCFFNADHELEGFRVNRAERNRLFPLKMPQSLRPGMALYRNNDVEFSKILAGKTAERNIDVNMRFSTTADGFALQVTDGTVEAQSSITFEHQEAQKPQHDNIVRQLSKLGGTIYNCSGVEIVADANKYFVPSSLLSELRHKAMEALAEASKTPCTENRSEQTETTTDGGAKLPHYDGYGYLYNIANSRAREFYASHGLQGIEPAFEVAAHRPADALLMQCRHCLRFAYGYCVKNGGKRPEWHEPLSLTLPDGKRFSVEFDCKHCQMNIHATK